MKKITKSLREKVNIDLVISNKEEQMKFEEYMHTIWRSLQTLFIFVYSPWLMIIYL